MIRVGTDIIEIHRMEQAIERDSFLQRVFTEYERNYAWGRNKQAAASFAGIFAAKEACVKALGTGFRHGSWQNIEITHDAWGGTCSYLYRLFWTTNESLRIRNVASFY